VETAIVQTALENWSGVENPVDAALLFNVLFHVRPAGRFFQLYRNTVVA